MKSPPSNLSNCKSLRKNKKALNLGQKNALFGYFWARTSKIYCPIWNQRPWICQKMSLCLKEWILVLGPLFLKVRGPLFLRVRVWVWVSFIKYALKYISNLKTTVFIPLQVFPDKISTEYSILEPLELNFGQSLYPWTCSLPCTIKIQILHWPLKV